MLKVLFFIACLATAIENFILGPVAYKLNKSDLTGRWLFLCLSVGIWSLGFGFEIMSRSGAWALAWAKLYYCGVAFIPATYFHFSTTLVGLAKAKRGIIRTGYVLALVMVAANLFGGIVSGVSPKSIFSNVSDPGPFFPALMVYFFLFVGYSGYLQVKAVALSRGYERTRVIYILVASLLGFLGGSTGFFIVYDWFKYSFLGMYFVWVYPCVIAYAIASVQLMDIEIFVRRTTRALMAIVVFALFLYTGNFFIHEVFKDFFGEMWVIPSSLIFALGVAAVVLFINHVFRMNEEDISEKFSYRPVLINLARRAAEAKSMEELLVFFTRATTVYARLEYMGVLLLDDDGDGYTLIKSLTRTKKRKKMPEGIKVSRKNAMVSYLGEHRKVLNRSKTEFELNKRSLSFGERRELIAVDAQMKDWDINLCVPCYSENVLLGIFLLGQKFNREMFLSRDEDLFFAIANQLAKPIHNFLHKKKAIEGFIRSQDVVVRAVEAKDPYTKGHSERVAEISYLIGEKLGMEKNRLELLKYAARLHDIGKIAIRDSILNKEGKLTPEEYEEVRRHPVESVKMIQPIAGQLGEDVIEAILHHHENLDGTGYPDHQEDGSIHIFAKIIKCADTLDALVSSRPYRKQKTCADEIIEEFRRYSSKQFDPEVAGQVMELCEDGEFILWLKTLLRDTGAISRI